MAERLHDLLLNPSHGHAGKIALRQAGSAAAPLRYEQLAAEVERTSAALLEQGLEPNDRVAVYLEKRPEAVVGLFAAAAAGGIAVPINPVLKPDQVAHILQDAEARFLITSAARSQTLQAKLEHCPALAHIWWVDEAPPPDLSPVGPAVHHWDRRPRCAAAPHPQRIEHDAAMLLYTSGSTGLPKGVILSHRNVIAGASSVVAYLENDVEDRILAALPLSFDYGFSQLTTAFLVGAEVILHDYLLPQDLPRRVAEYGVTGVAAVPPMWFDLAELPWPAAARGSVRYLTNSGGALPRPTVEALRRQLPEAQLYLMYGLTEAFRSTYLPPGELDARPDSIGRAIPNAEVQVVRPDGTRCAAYEHGELVHRGPQVALGYWRAPEATAERFRPAPNQPGPMPLSERAVWSGDTVYADEDGYLYFVGRTDELIKTSGYRVSPQEIEAAVLEIGGVQECVAAGVPDPRLGQTIGVVLATAAGADVDRETIQRACRSRLPSFMVPGTIRIQEHPLPRTANGKVDRAGLREHLLQSRIDGDEPAR